MMGEEAMILGGDGSTPLGTTPTPTLVASATGGALASRCLVGDRRRAVLRRPDEWRCFWRHAGVDRADERRRHDRFVRRRRIGPAFGCASDRDDFRTSGGLARRLRTKPVRGALGYAWFWGAVGAETLGAITTINSLVIVAAAAGTQTAASLGTSDSRQPPRLRRTADAGGKSGPAPMSPRSRPAGGTGTPLTAEDPAASSNRRGAEIALGQLPAFA